ncbi:MAG: glycosyltransferase family 2 protein [bacterium]|nr:glycosyltransferase family 2 protein [bacterium]
MTKNSIWVIIPAYNEAKKLPVVLQKLNKQGFQYIVVDDGSSDQTLAVAQKHSEHVLSHKINLGKGAALKTGCEYAFSKLNGEGVIFFDADDQHEATEIELFAAALEAHDVVFGVRSFDENMPLIRIMLNRLASVFLMLLFGSYIPDIPSGFKALSKRAYKQVAWNSSDYSVEMEIAARVAKAKLDFVTIPVTTIYHELDRGMTFIDTLKVLLRALSWRISL